MRCASLAVVVCLWLASSAQAADYLLIVPDFILLSAPGEQAASNQPPSEPPSDATGMAIPAAAPCADGNCALPAARPARRGFFRLRR